MRKFFYVLFAVLVFSVSAQANPYGGADEQTAKVLKKVDDYVKQEKYLSAWLSCVGVNEYIIAKKTELCCKYFAFSFMHKSFSFKDLENGETLMSVRSDSASQSLLMFLWNPVEICEKYLKTHDPSPVLDYALGLYFNDVGKRYSGRWDIGDDEIFDKMVLYWRKAFDNGIYSSELLSEMGLAYLKTADYKNSRLMYSKMEELSLNYSADDSYNYALVNAYLKDYDTAIVYMKKAIKLYDKMTQFQYDAYSACADFYMKKKDYEGALKILSQGRKIYKDDYMIELKCIRACALGNDKKNTLKFADSFFALGAEAPAASNMIIQEFFNDGVKDWLSEFFDEQIKKYKKQPMVLQNLYFAYTKYYLNCGERVKAAEWAGKAKAQFKENGTLTPEIEKMLDL